MGISGGEESFHDVTMHCILGSESCHTHTVTCTHGNMYTQSHAQTDSTFSGVGTSRGCGFVMLNGLVSAMYVKAQVDYLHKTPTPLSLSLQLAVPTCDWLHLSLSLIPIGYSISELPDVLSYRQLISEWVHLMAVNKLYPLRCTQRTM